MKKTDKVPSRLAWGLVMFAVLGGTGGCASQRAWNDTRPGDTGPDVTDVAHAILGLGASAAYFFAQAAGGGSSPDPFSMGGYPRR